MDHKLPIELWTDVFRQALMPLVPNRAKCPQYPFLEDLLCGEPYYYKTPKNCAKIFVDLVSALRLTCRTFNADVSSIDFVRDAFPRASYVFNRVAKEFRFYWMLNVDPLELHIELPWHNSDCAMKKVGNECCLNWVQGDAFEYRETYGDDKPFECGCGKTGKHCGDGHLVDLLLLPEDIAFPDISLCAGTARIWLPGVAYRLNKFKNHPENAGRYCHVKRLTIADCGEDHEWIHEINMQNNFYGWTCQSLRALDQALERWTPPGQNRILQVPFVCRKCDEVNFDHEACVDGCREFCTCYFCEEYRREFSDEDDDIGDDGGNEDGNGDEDADMQSVSR